MFVGDHNVSSSVPLISSDPVQPNKKSVLANIGNHIGETANNFLEALPVANRIVHWANERYGVAEERDRFLCARINDLTAAYAIFLHNSIYGKQKISNSNYCKRIHMKDK